MCDTKLKLLEQHCTNLESIELKVTKENINGVKSLLTKVRSLISINLETEQEVENHVGIVELLKLQPGLRSLKLNNFWGDELFKVRNLVDLEELKIINRWDDILNIHELCYPLKKLRKLKMICMAFTASEEFEGAPCPALRELHLLVWDYLFLKTQCLSTPACLKWIQSHGEILEVLVLDLNFALCKKDVVSQQDICKILSECRKLRSFHMELLAMDSDIAHRIVKIVSENGVTSEERPLELYFHDNEVHDQIKAAMANTSAKNIFTFKDTLLCILKKLKK
nr:uncharacterized protein LOC121502226 [Drosophila kikkawai]